MEQQHEVKILTEIKNVSWFRLVDNSKQLLSKGVFKICSLSEQNIYYINQDDFYFTIQKQIPFISVQFQTHKTYLFPHIENGFNAICVELDEEVITQLDIILSNVATFLTKDLLDHQDETLRNSINTHCVSIFETPLIDDNQTLHYIKKGGDILKNGFVWLGKTAATGVNKAGEYIGSKISSTKKVEVSQETKEKFQKIKDTTTKTVSVSAGFLSAVLEPMVDATSKYVKQINEKIDKGDNETLKKIKKIGGATLDATTEALQGLGKGVCEVGKSIGDNTRNLVEKKYGDDVTNTFLGQNDEQKQKEQQQGYTQLNQTDQTQLQ
ncbi:hypothetical protein ABPG72_015524 [Tetrahymena utriculariae]